MAMDPNRVILLPNQIKSPLKRLEDFKKEYTMALSIPSISSSYSTCVEYVRQWVKDKFQPSYFKSEYITGKNILNDYLTKDVLDIIKKMKPALVITPRLDYEYNRETSDLYEFGRHININRMRYNNAFFKDRISGNIASIQMKQLRVTFTVKIKVNSYNHAMDLYEFANKAFRVGASETRYASMDFQVPKEVVLAIAEDAHFAIKDGDVEDKCEFLRYLNKNSRIPFMYKFRGTKGEYEYFIRMEDMYIHFKSEQAELDEGEREGQTDNNFVVTIGEIECLFPAPMFYAYFSKVFHKFNPVTVTKDGNQFHFQDFSLGIIPCKNDKGWNQYLTSNYVEDDEKDSGFDKPICFKELLQSKSSSSLFDIAEYTKSIFISPETFMDIQLFNENRKVDIKIDWNTYTIYPVKPLKDRVSQVAIYVCLEYINSYTVKRTNGLENRIKDDNNFL